MSDEVDAARVAAAKKMEEEADAGVVRVGRTNVCVCAWRLPSASRRHPSHPYLHTQQPTIFDKIAENLIPTKFIYEDDQCVAFHDLSPQVNPPSTHPPTHASLSPSHPQNPLTSSPTIQGPVHFLVIPKDRQGLSRLSKATEAHKPLLGHLVFVAQQVAKEQGLTPGGFRLVINDGPAGSQSVYHLHIHVIGGRQVRGCGCGRGWGGVGRGGSGGLISHTPTTQH